MITEYLESRKEELHRVIAISKEEYEHNQIAIEEAETRIKELENTEDEATKIFLVKTGKNNTYNAQEIRNLEGQIFSHAEKNEILKRQYEDAEKELKIIQSCFEELENVSRETFSNNEHDEIVPEVESKEAEATVNLTDDVSRETLEQSDSLMDRQEWKKELQRKIEFCKNLAQVDGARVYVELDKILRQLS